MASEENKDKNPNVSNVWISMDRFQVYINTRPYEYGDKVKFGENFYLC